MASPSLKPLPHNLDAERSVLGAILIDDKYLAEATAILHSGDFFVPENRVIFSTMLAIKDSGEALDSLTLVDTLSKTGKMEAAGGIGYVSMLGDGVPKIANVGSYARIVKEKSRARVLMNIAENIQTRAWDERDDIGKMEEQLRAALSSASPIHTNGNGHRHPAYSLMDFLATQFPVPEHLVEGLVPRGGSVLILAMPHRLKSWFTTGLALGCSRAGKALGVLEVKKPVRTMIVQVEDLEGDLQWRMGQLLRSPQFSDCDPANVAVIGRAQFGDGYTKEWSQWLRAQVRDFRADLVIMDVLRRFFVGRGDLNAPGDTGDFLEEIDLIRAEGAAVALVHHENRKDAELMGASAGSYNFPGWANVVIQLKRKTEHGQGEDRMTCVEIEADNKLGQAPDALRLVLQLSSPSAPLRLEEIGDGDDWREAQQELAGEWTVRDLSEIYGIHRTSALRRLKKWMAKGVAEKVSDAKRGSIRGHARYRFLDVPA